MRSSAGEGRTPVWKAGVRPYRTRSDALWPVGDLIGASVASDHVTSESCERAADLVAYEHDEALAGGGPNELVPRVGTRPAAAI